jgi:hypothetical protein
MLAMVGTSAVTARRQPGSVEHCAPRRQGVSGALCYHVFLEGANLAKIMMLETGKLKIDFRLS